MFSTAACRISLRSESESCVDYVRNFVRKRRVARCTTYAHRTRWTPTRTTSERASSENATSSTSVRRNVGSSGSRAKASHHCHRAPSTRHFLLLYPELTHLHTRAPGRKNTRTLTHTHTRACKVQASSSRPSTSSLLPQFTVPPRWHRGLLRGTRGRGCRSERERMSGLVRGGERDSKEAEEGGKRG